MRPIRLKTRDNTFVPHIPTAFVNQTHLARVVDKSIQKVGRLATRVRYDLGTDSSGDPALFFRIVLPDAAIRKAATLIDVTKVIEAILFKEIRPYEDWGVIPYFNYRSKSEQDQLNDPDWA
jgi:hypothetical protein